MPLRSRLPQIAAKLDNIIDSGVRDVAEDVARDAQGRVPVDSGVLRDSIHVEGSDGEYQVIAGDRDAFYGHLVEFGTALTPARPFLIPAAESARDSLRIRTASRLKGL